MFGSSLRTARGIEIKIDVAAHRRRERGEQAIIVLRGEGIELVIVAARTADGEAQHGRAGSGQHVVHRIIAHALDFVRCDLRGEHARAEKAGGHHGFGIARCELIARELPLHKLCPRQVVVECADHEVAVMPCVGPVVVVLKAGAFGEAGHIKPVARPAFAIVRRGEEI